MAHGGIYMKLVTSQDVEKLAKESAPNSEKEAGETVILLN